MRGLFPLGLSVAVAVALVVPSTLPPARRTGGAGPVHLAAQPAAAVSSHGSGCTSNGTTVTCQYGYTGATQTLALPSDIGSGDSTISVTLNGAGGNGGGAGGQVTGTLANVADGSTLQLNVGGTGGWPDGGGGNCNGAGGTSLWVGGSKVAEAGGGGGCGGSYNASGGGGGTGGAADGSGGNGGNGGKQAPLNCNGYGGHSGASGGGGGGTACSGPSSGGNASGSQGGGGGGGYDGGPSGGGGGGGWVGGGGGGGADIDAGGGGGGGGSDGWSSSAFSGTPTSTPGGGAGGGGNGSATVSWTLVAPTVSQLIGSATLGEPDANLVAIVSDSIGYVPTGTVTFVDLSTNQQACSATLVPYGSGSASATCAFTDDSPGDTVYLASYSGDDTLASGQGGDEVNGVPAPTTTATVTATVDSSASPPTISLSTTVTPQSYSLASVGGDTVDFYDQFSTTTPVCTNTISSSVAKGAAGPASCTFGAQAPYPVPGTTYQFTATFVGDADNAGSSSSCSSGQACAATVGKYDTTTSLVANGTTNPVSVVYGTTVTLQATVHGLPSSDTSGTGTLQYEYQATGGDVACQGLTQPVAVTLGSGGGVVDGTVPPCVFTPGVDAADNQVVAVFGGDAQSNGSTSSVPSISVTQATSSFGSLTVSGQGGNVVGVPTTLTAVVKNTDDTVAPTGGVTFYEGSGAGAVAITGCDAAQTAASGVAGSAGGVPETTYTCTHGPAPAALGQETFSASYCPAASGVAACDDWTQSTASNVYAPSPDPTTVTIAPSGTELGPVEEVGGQPITLTATVALTAGDAAPTGTVSFVENGNPVTAQGGAACSGLALTPGPGTGSAATGSATCSFVPEPGGEDQVVAEYVVASGSLTAGATSKISYYSVSGAPTTTTVALATAAGVVSGSSVPYGEPVTLTATVDSGGVPVAEGTVAFSENGSPVTSGGTDICQQVVVSNGVADCPVPNPPAGSLSLGATYAYAGGSYANSTAPPASYTVTPATTTTTLAVGPDPTSAGDLALTATVTDTSAGSVAAPSGTLSFSQGGNAIAACSAVALVPGSGGTATATCAGQPIPGATTGYSASFTPASGNFAASGPASATFTPGAACSATFSALWGQAGSGGATLSFGVGPDGIGVGTLSATVPGVTGGCNSASTIPVTGGSLSLFGGTLAVASGLHGYLEDGQAGAAPSLCLTGGSLALPSGWGAAGHPLSVDLSSSAELCLAVTGAGSGGDTLGGVSGGRLVVSGITLPFGVPDGSVTYDLELVLTTTGTTPQLTATFAPASVPATTPYVDATVDVTSSAGAWSAAGTATLENLPFGGPATVSFTAGTGTGGSIGGSLTFSYATCAPGGSCAPWAPLPGLELENLTATLSSAGGLGFAGTGIFGNPSSATALTLAVTGGYSGGTFSLGVHLTSPRTWSPFSSLTLTLPSLAGTITVTTTGDVTYDVEAGSPLSAGPSATPLVAWDPVTGVAVDVDCVALAFGTTPACASGSLQSPTDPSLALQGSIALGGGSGASGGTGGLTVDVQGTIDLRTGGVAFTLLSPVTVPVVSGLSITVDSLSVTGGVGSGIEVNGSASATVPSLSSSPVTVTVTDQDGALVVAVAGVDLSNLGLPLSGFFAYSSAPVTSYATGDPTFGSVSLAQGFNADGSYTPSAGVASTLQAAGFTLPPGGTITFSGSWDPGSSPTFVAALNAPPGFPFLALPDGGSITSATLSFSAGTLSLAVDGVIPVPGQAVATVAVDVDVGLSDGSFTGTATVSGLSVFGVSVGLTGTLGRSASGTVTADVSTCQPQGTGCVPGPIAGPITPFAGVPVQLSNVELSLGTSGLTVSGTLSVAGLASLSVSGSLQSLQQWTLTVAAEQAQAWQPVPSVTIDAALSGTISDTNGPISFTLSASGVGSNPLFDLSVAGVSLTVDSVELGNAAPPSGCSVGTLGDLWLSVDGSLGLSLSGFSGSVAAGGCFDLSTHSLELSATLSNLSASFLGGAVQLGAPTLTLSESNGSYQVTAALVLTVGMPGGGTLVQRATISFEPAGAFVVGTEANLSQWLGTSGDTAELYYASQAVSGFVTGDPALGSIDLSQGLNFALTISLPGSAITDLADVGINLPSGTGLVAVGTADFATNTYTLRISVSFGSGITLFSDGGASMVLDSGFLQVELSPAGPQFGVGMTATLNLPSPGSMGSASSVGLTGALTVSDTGINVSLSLGDCAGSAAGWVDAFGVSGLTIKCANVQGGISFGDGIPLPNVGFDGTITSLPSSIANAIGYMNDAPITFAFNFAPFLLSLSIGTENSGTPALEPLAAFGQGSLIEIDYASLYISPEGAVIGNTTYPAGLGLGFQASIEGIDISVLADIGLAPPSIHFTGSISQITLGGLSIGPVSVTLDASTSPPSFDFQFDGSLSLGPGSAQIGPALEVGGSFSASVEIDVSTSGISAFIWGSVSVEVAVYVPTAVCYYDGWIPYPCNYQWEGTAGSFTLGKTGFSVNGSGITLEADGYSVTFDYNGTVSVDALTRGGRRVPIRTVSQVEHVLRTLHALRGHPHWLALALAAARSPVGQGAAEGAGTSASPGPVHLVGPVRHVGTAVLLSVVHRPAGPARSTGSARSAPSARSAGSPAHPVRTALLRPQDPLARVVPTGSAPLVGAGGAPTGRWRSAAGLVGGRGFASVAALHGGDVLVAGGFGTGGQALRSAEVYDPATGSWTVTGAMATARVGASTAVLADGDVLVAGGEGPGHAPLASAELYHPATGTWTATGSLVAARAFSSTIVLADGDVLVAGGEGPGHAPLASAELYHPATGTWTATGSLATPRALAAGAALPGGGALVAGGFDGHGPLAGAERYDAATGRWSSAGSMSVPRLMAAAATLPGGDVLVVGDGDTADRYDPATGTWSATDGMAVPRTLPSVVALPDGDVLVAGGESAGHAVASAELYHPGSGLWTSAGSMGQARSAAAAVALSNGQVLVAGGTVETTRSSGAVTVGVQSSVDLYTLDAHRRPVVPAGTPPVAAAGGLSASDYGGIFAGLAGLGLLGLVGAGLAEYRRRYRRR